MSNKILPYGIRSRFNASTYESNTVWKDVYGNHDAVNISITGSELSKYGQAFADYFTGSFFEVIRKEGFEENQQAGKIPAYKGFPYLKGDEFSKWKLTEKFPKDNWTVAYVTRYDPTDHGPCKATRSNGPCRNRILMYGNSAFGHDFNKVGYSSHNADHRGYGEVGGDTYGEVKSLPGDNAQWLFAIEQPKRSIVRGEFSNDWMERKDGLADDLTNVELHINTSTQVSRWNVADIIYWPRKLQEDEIEMVKEYLDAYKEGEVDVFKDTTLTEPPAPSGGGNSAGGNSAGGNSGNGDDDDDEYNISYLKNVLLMIAVICIVIVIVNKLRKSKKYKEQHYRTPRYEVS